MKTRVFDIPYIFSVTGTPKRGTKERQGFFFEKVEVTIPDLTTDEAPIAATFPEQFGATTYVGERCTVELRHRDRKLFAKALLEYSGTHIGVTPDMLDGFLTGGIYAVENSFALDMILPDRASTLQRGLFPGADDHHNPIKLFEEAYWSSFQSKDRTQQRTRAEAMSLGLIVVDGQFWREVPEPRYQVIYRHAERGEAEYVNVAVVDPGDRHLRSGTRYGLTNWERMARDIRDRHGIDLDERQRADVLIEEAFPFDDALESFLTNVTDAISHDGDMLKSMEVQSMIAWARMRDAMTNVRNCGCDPQSLDQLAVEAEIYGRCPDASQRARAAIEAGIRSLDDRTVFLPDIVQAVSTPKR